MVKARPGQQLEAAQRPHTDLCKDTNWKSVTHHLLDALMGYRSALGHSDIPSMQIEHFGGPACPVVRGLQRQIGGLSEVSDAHGGLLTVYPALLYAR
eukprot:1151760-Pelagomonas_calceolata.AAC.1